MRNPIARVGEKGGFRWVFRRFWLEMTTISGNFKARFTAGEHPFGYLVSSADDENIEGYCQTLYMVGMLLTTDQGFVDDINRAIRKYEKRLEAKADVSEDPVEEEIALESEKELAEYLELPSKERKKAAKEIDKRFKKAVKDVQERTDGAV